MVWTYEHQDVICYGDGSCYITATGYGGWRYYYIPANSQGKNQMVAAALTAYITGTKGRFAFVPNNLNCADVPLGTEVYGFGATSG